MSSDVFFTPLWGANSEGAVCFLLEVDGCRLLLDCGWSESFDPDLLDPLAKLIELAGGIDAVLLSHCDMEHLGGLPYAMAKLGLQAPVYVTIPVYKMGQMVMYDAWAACRRQRDMSLFSLGDIDQAFDKMVQLKYSQTHALTGRGAGIEITPYAAGHTIGGAVWRIQKETEDIIYALDYNHKPERHLNPTLLETLQNPTLLITDAYNMNVNQIARQKRDEDLTSTILSALRADGEVLLPVDAAGRVLELLIVLEQYWTANKLHYPIIFLSAVANSTIEYAKSQMEWMSEKLQERFQQQRENPYNLRHVQLVHSLEELDRISKPRVVLATMPSLTVGHAQELFFEMAQNPNNQVIFTTSRGLPGTLAKQLISPATEVKPIHISTQVYRRVPLEGEELEEYMNKQQQEAEAAELARKQEEEAKRRLRNAAASEAYEGEDVDSAKSLVNLWKSYDLFAEREETTLKSMSVYPMFPYVESRAIYDEYGEAIRPEDYATAGDDDEAGSFGWNGQLATIDDDDDMMDVDGADAVPTKSISVDVEVDVACRIKYIDFEGRSDGRSIPKILSRVAPQQLIVVHGTKQSIEALATYCRENLKSEQVLCPRNKETVSVASNTNLFRVPLPEELLASLNIVKVGDTELALINARIQTRDQPQKKSMDGEAMLPALEFVLTPSQGRLQNATWLGDVKLHDFRQLLTQRGFRTEFKSSGVLTVNDLLTVRKEGDEANATLVVEGPFCDDYFLVRELLFSKLTVL